MFLTGLGSAQESALDAAYSGIVHAQQAQERAAVAVPAKPKPYMNFVYGIGLGLSALVLVGVIYKVFGPKAKE